MEDKRVVCLELHGRSYPLCLTVAANEQINETLGGLGSMTEAMKQAPENAAGMYTQLLHILLCGGASRVNALAQMTGKAADSPEVPDLDILRSALTQAEVAECKAKIFEAIHCSTRVTVEVEPSTPKNASTTQG